VIDSGHTLEELVYLLLFPPQLFLIIEMLILAASAGGEEGAARLPAIWALVNHFHKVCMGTAGVVFPDSGPYSLSWETKRDKYHPAACAFFTGKARGVDSSDPGAEIGEGVNLQLHDFVVAEGFWPEFPWGFYAFSHSPIHFGLSERDRTSRVGITIDAL